MERVCTEERALLRDAVLQDNLLTTKQRAAAGTN